MLSAIGEDGPAHGGACSAAAAFSVERMEARDRFISALAEAVSTVYYAEGELYLSIENINAIAEAEQVPDPEARADPVNLSDPSGLFSCADYSRITGKASAVSLALFPAALVAPVPDARFAAGGLATAGVGFAYHSAFSGALSGAGAC